MTLVPETLSEPENGEKWGEVTEEQDLEEEGKAEAEAEVAEDMVATTTGVADLTEPEPVMVGIETQGEESLIQARLLMEIEEEGEPQLMA